MIKPLAACDRCLATFALNDLRMLDGKTICESCYENEDGDCPWVSLAPVLPIDYEGLDGLANFLGELLRDYRDRDHGDIDGFEFQELLSKHGLTYSDEITTEECEEEWAREWDYEPGDLFYRYSPTMLTLMRRKP